MSRTLIEMATERLKTIRGMTKQFLKDLTADEWFWMPPGNITHVAWQVGHTAFAEYSLCMKRQRGERPEDAELILADFADAFGRGSTPAAGADNNPPPTEIIDVLDRVHRQALTELANYDDNHLNVACEPKHPMFKTNLDAIFWASEHETTHVGQIVLLRRMMGKQPQW